MKKILVILVLILSLFSCSKGEIERYSTNTYYNVYLANTIWKGKRMNLEFIDDRFATITNNLSFLNIDTFNVSYVVGNDHIGMLCEDYHKYDFGINIENGYFVSKEKMVVDFVFILTNEGKIDTISYTENFIKQ